MLIRLSLDPQLDADLIARIEKRANGGSVNKAVRLLLAEWLAVENDRKLSISCQPPVNSLSNSDNSREPDDFNLSSFESAFDNM